MEIISDASAFLAIVLNESDREWVIEKTRGASIVAPEILPYEIGNALTAILKRGRLNTQEILQAYDIARQISVMLIPVEIAEALKIAARFNLYAYDAYYLQCCIEKRLPLISLDGRMREVAGNLKIKVVE
jgi:predicted nucleic acid-binding protein